jgi:class 3 adenylate cyclase/tetratricopeptide (TPR) repeat protein
MSSIWQSYVPYHVARDLARFPGADPIGREQRIEAVTLFVDVAGFTAMSEALAATGKGGTEELTTVLNTYFEPTVDLIRSYGGIVAKFSGDGMTVLFPYPPASRVAVARRAIQCALDVQDQMERYAAIRTQAGNFTLSVKSGLAVGTLFCTIVGDPAIRLEYIIAGGALDRCAEAEHQASRGEVVVHDDLLAAAGEVDIVEKRGVFSCVACLRRRAKPDPLPPLGELGPEAIEIVTACLHPSIARRVGEGQTSFINEHRRVTVLFVRFDGFDYDGDPEVGAKLQTYLSRVIRVVHRYDGYLSRVDMGDKGSKCLVLFGAPIAHEDDVERGLRCALELCDLPDATVRVGINTAFVYCGLVGSAVRQEYTVMGDGVNLAARLMQAAQSRQIIVGDATRSASGRSFEWESSTSIRVKGKSEPVRIHTLAGLKQRTTLRLQEPEYALPMVGRERELEVTQERLARVLRGQGQIVGITAEAGMGKSRLAAEIIKLATGRGLAGYGGECLSHGVNTSYLVWRNLMRGFFGLDPAWPLDEQLRHLEAELAALDASLVQRMPLLGSVLNLSVPENALTRSLDARLCKESLEALVIACIRRRAEGMPLLLVLEDCHWIDPLSHDLLEAVGRNVVDVPVLMLVIYRPPETERACLRVSRMGHFAEIRLANFTYREAEHLIALKLARLFGVREWAEIPDVLVERITERAQGNPFYIDEMINLIHDRGIDLADTEALQSLDLPDSLHSLIISRIDQLAEGAKTTLKVASVIGRIFCASWLWGIYPQLGTPEQVREQLALLSRLDITSMDKPEPELEYLFRHIVTREVAYESLSVATRTMLHGQAGQFIERTYPESLERYVDLLAYHYGRGQNVEKQREYFRKAGAAAQAAYANDAAIDYYRRLLSLLPEKEQPGVMLKLGQVWHLIGKWDEAGAIYRQALALAERAGDRRMRGQCERAVGTHLRFKGLYAKALEWLGRARSGFETLGDQQGLGDALREIGIVHWSQGDYPRALAYFEQCLQIATGLGDQRGIYRAVGNMGIVYKSQGNYSQALACYEQCQQIATELGDRLGASKATGNKGSVYLDQGDYPRALTCYAQRLQIALEIGVRQGVGIAIGNIGDVYLNYGDYARALACLTQNLQIALEIGDRLGVSFALWNMAVTYVAQERCDEAERLLTRAIILGRALDTPYEMCDYLYTYADLHVRREQYAAAQPLNDEALSIAAQVEHKDVQFKAQVLALCLRIVLGQIAPPEAVGEFERLLGEWPDDAEQAAIQYEIWRVDQDQEPHRQQAADLYRALYAQTPNVEYKQRYEELTGECLPDPPPLPPLPDIVTQHPPDREVLLAQVDALIA